MFAFRPRITCKDGFSMSVQASRFVYSEPREDRGPYTHVEVGFPSREVSLLNRYIETSDWHIEMSDSDPTQSVYPMVPIELVQRIIEECGGVEGEIVWEQPGLPSLVIGSAGR